MMLRKKILTSVMAIVIAMTFAPTTISHEVKAAGNKVADTTTVVEEATTVAETTTDNPEKVTTVAATSTKAAKTTVATTAKKDEKTVVTKAVKTTAANTVAETATTKATKTTAANTVAETATTKATKTTAATTKAATKAATTVATTDAVTTATTVVTTAGPIVTEYDPFEDPEAFEYIMRLHARYDEPTHPVPNVGDHIKVYGEHNFYSVNDDIVEQTYKSETEIVILQRIEYRGAQNVYRIYLPYTEDPDYAMIYQFGYEDYTKLEDGSAYLLGDYDGDMAITAFDLTRMRYLLAEDVVTKGTQNLPRRRYWERITSDFNSDGYVNVADLVSMYNQVMGKTSF